LVTVISSCAAALNCTASATDGLGARLCSTPNSASHGDDSVPGTCDNGNGTCAADCVNGVWGNFVNYCGSCSYQAQPTPIDHPACPGQMETTGCPAGYVRNCCQ